MRKQAQSEYGGIDSSLSSNRALFDAMAIRVDMRTFRSMQSPGRRIPALLQLLGGFTA